MADWINQSVPRPNADGTVDPQKLAMLDMLMGEENEEAMRQQALVDQLRNYGGGAMPQMRGRYAPQPLEYAATLANRLVGMGGETGVRDASGAALEALRRKLYPDTASQGVPADPSFAGVGAAPY